MSVARPTTTAPPAEAPPPPAATRRRGLPLPQQTLVRHLIVALVGGLILYLITTYLLGSFDDLNIATAAYYFCAVAGLTVLTGLNGQISLGHGALMAVGAYTTAILTSRTGWGLGPALAASALTAAIVGAILGMAAARLRGPYLAGATLAFAVGLPALANKYPSAFGGENGISVNPPTPPASLGFDFPLERWQAWIACIAALVVFVLLANVVRSRLGRSMRAVRDDEVAAQLAGLHVARTQVTAFVISAACAGVGGGLLVMVTQVAGPGAFDLPLSLALLTGAVLGGLGSMAGAIWGALALVWLPRWSTDLANSLNLSEKVQANLPLAIYGLVLIVAMIAAPGGIQAAVRGVAARLSRRSADEHGTTRQEEARGAPKR